MKLSLEYRVRKLEKQLLKQDDSTWKQKALASVLKNNPMQDDYHVGIRSIDDILTLEEAIEYSREENGDCISGWPDCSDSLYEKELKSGKITIYSYYPIKPGTFVTPSKVQAQEYAGGSEYSGHKGSKVYSKTVDLYAVAWINADEGQYI